MSENESRKTERKVRKEETVPEERKHKIRRSPQKYTTQSDVERKAKKVETEEEHPLMKRMKTPEDRVRSRKLLEKIKKEDKSMYEAVAGPSSQPVHIKDETTIEDKVKVIHRQLETRKTEQIIHRQLETRKTEQIQAKNIKSTELKRSPVIKKIIRLGPDISSDEEVEANDEQGKFTKERKYYYQGPIIYPEPKTKLRTDPHQEIDKPSSRKKSLAAFSSSTLVKRLKRKYNVKKQQAASTMAQADQSEAMYSDTERYKESKRHSIRSERLPRERYELFRTRETIDLVSGDEDSTYLQFVTTEKEDITVEQSTKDNELNSLNVDSKIKTTDIESQTEDILAKKCKKGVDVASQTEETSDLDMVLLDSEIGVDAVEKEPGMRSEQSLTKDIAVGTSDLAKKLNEKKIKSSSKKVQTKESTIKTLKKLGATGEVIFPKEVKSRRKSFKKEVQFSDVQDEETIQTKTSPQEGTMEMDGSGEKDIIKCKRATGKTEVDSQDEITADTKQDVDVKTDKEQGSASKIEQQSIEMLKSSKDLEIKCSKKQKGMQFTSEEDKGYEKEDLPSSMKDPPPKKICKKVSIKSDEKGTKDDKKSRNYSEVGVQKNEESDSHIDDSLETDNSKTEDSFKKVELTKADESGIGTIATIGEELRQHRCKKDEKVFEPINKSEETDDKSTTEPEQKSEKATETEKYDDTKLSTTTPIQQSDADLDPMKKDISTTCKKKESVEKVYSKEDYCKQRQRRIEESKIELNEKIGVGAEELHEDIQDVDKKTPKKICAKEPLVAGDASSKNYDDAVESTGDTKAGADDNKIDGKEIVPSARDFKNDKCEKLKGDNLERYDTVDQKDLEKETIEASVGTDDDGLQDEIKFKKVKRKKLIKLVTENKSTTTDDIADGIEMKGFESHLSKCARGGTTKSYDYSISNDKGIGTEHFDDSLYEDIDDKTIRFKEKRKRVKTKTVEVNTDEIFFNEITESIKIITSKVKTKKEIREEKKRLKKEIKLQKKLAKKAIEESSEFDDASEQEQKTDQLMGKDQTVDLKPDEGLMELTKSVRVGTGDFPEEADEQERSTQTDDPRSVKLRLIGFDTKEYLDKLKRTIKAEVRQPCLECKDKEYLRRAHHKELWRKPGEESEDSNIAKLPKPKPPKKKKHKKHKKIREIPLSVLIKQNLKDCGFFILSLPRTFIIHGQKPEDIRFLLNLVLLRACFNVWATVVMIFDIILFFYLGYYWFRLYLAGITFIGAYYFRETLLVSLNHSTVPNHMKMKRRYDTLVLKRKQQKEDDKEYQRKYFQVKIEGGGFGPEQGIEESDQELKHFKKDSQKKPKPHPSEWIKHRKLRMKDRLANIRYWLKEAIKPSLAAVHTILFVYYVTHTAMFTEIHKNFGQQLVHQNIAIYLYHSVFGLTMVLDFFLALFPIKLFYFILPFVLFGITYAVRLLLTKTDKAVEEFNSFVRNFEPETYEDLSLETVKMMGYVSAILWLASIPRYFINKFLFRFIRQHRPELRYHPVTEEGKIQNFIMV